jgi:signal transduction histidine kinase
MHTKLDKHLPALIEELSNTESTDSMDVRWKSILQKIFTHSSFAHKASSIEDCQLINNGLIIQIPTIENNEAYELTSHDTRAPFNENDIQIARSLLTLARRFISIQQAIEKGASEERQRIARDLHDDVAARMLTLIHQLKDQSVINLVRRILKSLRNAIYTLDNRSTTTILDALTDIRSELQQRLNLVGMQVFWTQAKSLEKLIFTPRQHINLQRILHEIVTNVIRHAHAEYVTIDITLDNNEFIVKACDNGAGFEMEKCIPGKGINNITTRVKELNGSADWNHYHSKNNDDTGCCIDIRFPINLKDSSIKS